MSKPIVVDLPHKLGKEEARRRIAGGIGKLQNHIPGGADVEHSWAGDRLNLLVKAMGQQVTSQIDVQDTTVRVEVVLPAILGMFASKISAFLSSRGTDLLEDQSRK